MVLDRARRGGQQGRWVGKGFRFGLDGRFCCSGWSTFSSQMEGKKKLFTRLEQSVSDSTSRRVEEGGKKQGSGLPSFL